MTEFRKKVEELYDSVNIFTYDSKELCNYKKDAPEWVKDLFQKLHGDMIPNDQVFYAGCRIIGWVYESEADNYDDAFESLWEMKDTIETPFRRLLDWVSYETFQYDVDEEIQKGYIDLECSTLHTIIGDVHREFYETLIVQILGAVREEVSYA